MIRVDECLHLRDCEEGFNLQKICRQTSILHPHQTLLIQLLCETTRICLTKGPNPDVSRAEPDKLRPEVKNSKVLSTFHLSIKLY